MPIFTPRENKENDGIWHNTPGQGISYNLVIRDNSDTQASLLTLFLALEHDSMCYFTW